MFTRMNLSRIIILICALVPLVKNAKILFLVPMSTKSEKHLFEPLINQLAVEGHKVTVVTNTKDPHHENVKEIVPINVEEVFGPFSNISEADGTFWTLLYYDMSLCKGAYDKIYTNSDFQEALKEKYDLILTNSYFGQGFYGIIHKQDCPFILLHSFPMGNYFVKDLGYYMPPSHVPFPLLHYTSHMSFHQRLINLVLDWSVYFYEEVFNIPFYEKINRQYLGENLPSVKEMQKKISLVLTNTHFTSTNHRPLMPDIVEIGCLHCKKAKPLPKELEDFVGESSAPHGFIYISFGTVLKGTTMPISTRKKFVNVFSKLKQKVIWKWESESMEDVVPENILLKKWLPQQDILGHSNLRLFITHGGLLSVQQTMFHGSPAILFPFFFDQVPNAMNAVEQGIGIQLDIWNFTEEELLNAINRILQEQKFKERAQLMSEINKDQMNTPLERAMFWTNHVLKFKGAPHLRSSARQLNFIQLHSIDVLLFLFMALITFCFLTLAMYKKTLQLIYGKLYKKEKQS